MRVLHIGKYYPPVFGGIENVNFELVEGLNDVGVKCDVLCSSDTNVSTLDLSRGYKVYRERSLFKIASVPLSLGIIIKLRKIVDEYDVISVHLPNPLACLSLFFVKPHHKIVLHWHSDIIKQKKLLKLFSPIQRFAIRRSDLVLGATRAHIEQSDCSALFTNKSQILPYIFDVGKFTSHVDVNLLKELQQKYLGKKVVFSLGRLVYYKGFEDLIIAAKSLPEDIIILIAGVGELQKNLSDLIQEHDLSQKVKLIGAIPHTQLSSYYKFCDVFCLPSVHRSEMFGIVQLEAMAFGKPVISTNLQRSGVPLVNIDGKTGITVKPSSPVNLANALVEVLTDENKYNYFSKNALEHVKCFDKSFVINKLLKMYNELMEKS